MFQGHTADLLQRIYPVREKHNDNLSDFPATENRLAQLLQPDEW